MPNFCGVCASEDYTHEDQTDDGATFVVCTNPYHGESSRVWEPQHAESGRPDRGGIGAELGIWDKLLECVPPGSDFIPYGDVEDAFTDRFPDVMRRLIEMYGHRWREPRHPSDKYSASVYLGARLADLAREGLLEHQTGPATGRWAYNGTYEWWRVAGTG